MAHLDVHTSMELRPRQLHPTTRHPVHATTGPGCDLDLPSGHSTGFALGWDHAHHGLTPPVELLFTGSAIRQGWEAARKVYGLRLLPARAQTRRWLALRCEAWLHGIPFEATQVTPHYLQQLETGWCPVLRRALDPDAGRLESGSVVRARCDASYAAGNLVVMSEPARQAKSELGWHEAQALADSARGGPIHVIAGLNAAEWQRVTVLCSFVTPMPHDQAARIPLLLLPPNRLRLLNPIQALQALLTRQLALAGWHERLAPLHGAMTDQTRSAFDRFAMALLPRVHVSQSLPTSHEQRWALEDAWGDALVQKRWKEFASLLSETLTEQLVREAARLKLGKLHVQHHAADLATEGWALRVSNDAQPGRPWQKRSSAPN